MKGTFKPPYLPQDVNGLDLAFGGRASELMPDWDSIPKEHRNMNAWDNKWARFFSDWFYNGIEDLQVYPNDGIDPGKALVHLKGFIGSWEPKHEHKEAAFRYLCSLWFKDVSYTVKNAAAKSS